MSETRYYLRSRGRILGPFPLPKLLEMRDRRHLKQIHELSSDRVTWRPAKSFPEIFPPSRPEYGGLEDETPSGPGPTPASEPAAAPDWYYLVRGQSQGPVAYEVLQQLVATGTIRASDMVWNPEMPSWSVAETIPGLMSLSPRRQTPPLTGMLKVGGLIGGGVTACAVLGVFAWLVVLPWWAGSARITSLDQKDRIDRAIGYVVCGGTGEHLGEGIAVDFPISVGSCFCITPDGYLLTNAHVVANVQKMQKAPAALQEAREKYDVEFTPKIWVFFGRGHEYEATIEKVSGRYDVALLKISPKRGEVFPYFRLSGQRKLESVHSRATERVYAFGYPLSTFPAPQHVIVEAVKEGRGSVTIDGMLPEANYEMTRTDGTIGRLHKLPGEETQVVQHGADISPGNSGGPLLSRDAVVLGINTWGRTAETVDYSLAIAAHQLKNQLDGWDIDVEWVD